MAKMSKSKMDEYDAQGTPAEKEAEDETDDFKKGGKVGMKKKMFKEATKRGGTPAKDHLKRGGKVEKKEHEKHAHMKSGGHVHGEHAKARLDRPKRASGGRVSHSPFTSAMKTEGGAAEDTGKGDLPQPAWMTAKK